MRTEADVAVAGLGVLGAAAAAALARRGLSVVGLDRHRPPHGLGSSHGGTRIIRRVYPEGPLYLPLVDRAYTLWRRLEHETGRHLLLPRGGLYLGAADGELIRSGLACARQLRLEHELLDAEQVRQRFAPLAPPAATAAVFDPRAGVLRAEACVESLLGSAAAAGAELCFERPLLGWRSEGEAVRLDCGGQGLTVRHLLLATGAWLAGSQLPAARRLTVERQVQHWLAPRGAEAAMLPPFVCELSPRRTWYALPDLGDGLKAGLHHGGEPTTADAVRRSVGGEERREIRRLAERWLPGATGACLRSEVCLYTNTPDLRFLAGPLADRPRVWLLGGGSGHAFKFAPALGELVASGIERGRPPAALEPFLPR